MITEFMMGTCILNIVIYGGRCDRVVSQCVFADNYLDCLFFSSSSCLNVISTPTKQNTAKKKRKKSLRQRTRDDYVCTPTATVGRGRSEVRVQRVGGIWGFSANPVPRGRHFTVAAAHHKAFRITAIGTTRNWQARWAETEIEGRNGQKTVALRVAGTSSSDYRTCVCRKPKKSRGMQLVIGYHSPVCSGDVTTMIEDLANRQNVIPGRIPGQDPSIRQYIPS